MGSQALQSCLAGPLELPLLSQYRVARNSASRGYRGFRSESGPNLALNASMRKSVKKERTHAGALVGVGGAAAAAFAVLTAKSLKPRTILSDLRLRRLIPSYPRPARNAAV